MFYVAVDSRIVFGEDIYIIGVLYTVVVHPWTLLHFQ